MKGPGDPTRRAKHIAPGVLASLVAGGLGAATWAVFLGILLYLLAFMPKRRDTLVTLLGAPLVLALGSPVPSLLDPWVLLWLGVLIAALAPLFMVLGGRVPWNAVPFVAASALILALGIVLVRWTHVFIGADIGTRAQVLILGAMTLVVWSLAPFVKRPGRPAEEPTPTRSAGD